MDFETFEPEKVFEIALQKICLRRTFFNKLISRNNIEDVSAEALKEEVVVKKKKKKKPLLGGGGEKSKLISRDAPKTWDTFLPF